MNILIKFLLVMAWPIAVISLGTILLKVILDYQYNYGQSSQARLQRLGDSVKGIKRTFPIQKWAIALFVSVCYLITYYFLV